VIWFCREEARWCGRTDGCALDLGVRVLDARVVDCEHLVEGIGELEEGQRQEQYHEANVVACVALGVEALGRFQEPALGGRRRAHPPWVMVALRARHGRE